MLVSKTIKVENKNHIDIKKTINVNKVSILLNIFICITHINIIIPNIVH